MIFWNMINSEVMNVVHICKHPTNLVIQSYSFYFNSLSDGERSEISCRRTDDTLSGNPFDLKMILKARMII